MFFDALGGGADLREGLEDGTDASSGDAGHYSDVTFSVPSPTRGRIKLASIPEMFAGHYGKVTEDLIFIPQDACASP